MPYGAINKKCYEKKRTVLEYSLTALQIAEVMILIKYREYIVNKHILDIGCGAGRTTLPLTRLSKHYIGIDFSFDMVELCRRKFTNATFIHHDVRSMEIFEDELFDFVLFSYNGLDSISHDDRLKSFKEIHRVLKEDGLFVFSSHNRNYHRANSFPKIVFTPDPYAQINLLLKYFRSIVNFLKNRKLEQFNEEYAIINDKAHSYALLSYYIDKNSQILQNKSMGFETIEMYDVSGNILNPGDKDSHSAWIYYVTRKPMNIETVQ
ncbi:MAG: class I SAM-dependent methyltransferase [Planctomycetes bacterium]|nr:class I SAM-dependent methyltransferase [Planctomycetota bacterium]